MRPKVLGMVKPIIGMVHLPPLPGSPFWGGLSDREILDAARHDLDLLVSAGFDAIAISNEGDRPYIHDVPKHTVALFARLVSELTRDLLIPFGCGLLIDPFASLAVARAVGAAFVRLNYGVTAGVLGLSAESPGEILRYRRSIGATNIAVFANFWPHFSTALDTRDISEAARTYDVLTQPDAIQVPGGGPGDLPDLEAVRRVRDALPDVPVIVATGATAKSAAEVIALADGIIVGTDLKRGGVIWNPIDGDRARAFVVAARSGQIHP